jgi:hypothetical protein
VDYAATGSGGRDKLISDRLRVHLVRPFKGKGSKEEMTNADKIAENLVAAAGKNASLPAIAIIMDPPKASHSSSGP